MSTQPLFELEAPDPGQQNVGPRADVIPLPGIGTTGDVAVGVEESSLTEKDSVSAEVAGSTQLDFALGASAVGSETTSPPIDSQNNPNNADRRIVWNPPRPTEPRSEELRKIAQTGLALARSSLREPSHRSSATTTPRNINPDILMAHAAKVLEEESNDS